MSWGSYGRSSVPLSYTALKGALERKAVSKTGLIKNRSILFLYRRYVTAYFVGDVIALKLHNTEIVHYHADGTMTLYGGGGWIESQTTRQWIGNATGRYCGGTRPNDWSDHQYVLYCTPRSVFYDGMRVNRDGELLSEVKPLLKKVPNAEAKALRRRLTALAKIYRNFAKLHEGSPQTFENHSRIDVTTIDPKTHEFDLELYAQLQHRYSSYRQPPPYARVQATLAKAYVSAVQRKQLFDTTEVNPGESQ